MFGGIVDVDIRFFQAAATAIPTLFIAMAVSAKIFHPGDGPGNMFAPTKMLDVGFAYAALVGFAATEMLALAVLAFDTPRIGYAYWVGFIISLQLVYLIGGTMSVAADKYRPESGRHHWLTAVVTIGGVLIPGGTFLLVALSAGV